MCAGGFSCRGKRQKGNEGIKKEIIEELSSIHQRFRGWRSLRKLQSKRLRKVRGFFWPVIRKRVLEKAVELYMKGNFRNSYFTGQSPEVEVLKESGYLHLAKILVLGEASRN